MMTHTLTRRQALLRLSAGIAGGVAALQVGLPMVASAAAPLGAAATTTLQAWISRGAPQKDLIAQQIKKYKEKIQDHRRDLPLNELSDGGE